MGDIKKKIDKVLKETEEYGAGEEGSHNYDDEPEEREPGEEDDEEEERRSPKRKAY